MVSNFGNLAALAAPPWSVLLSLFDETTLIELTIQLQESPGTSSFDIDNVERQTETLLQAQIYVTVNNYCSVKEHNNLLSTQCISDAIVRW